MIKALILAAGMGTRLLPRTKNKHKCLTEVNGVPIINNTINALTKENIFDITVVVGYLANDVRNHFRKCAYEVMCVENKDYNNTNTVHSLHLGLNALGDYESLLVLDADVFFEHKIIKTILAADHDNATLLEKFNPHLSGTFVELDNNGFVVDCLHENMRAADYDLTNLYKTINIHKFEKKFVYSSLGPVASKIDELSKGQGTIEDVIRYIVLHDTTAIYGVTVSNTKWVEVDNEADLLYGEKMFRMEHIA